MTGQRKFHFAVITSSGTYGLGDTLPEAAKNAYVSREQSIIIAGDSQVKAIVGVNDFGSILYEGVLRRSPLFKPVDLLTTDDLASALLDRVEASGAEVSDRVFYWLEAASLGNVRGLK